MIELTLNAEMSSRDAGIFVSKVLGPASRVAKNGRRIIKWCLIRPPVDTWLSGKIQGIVKVQVAKRADADLLKVVGRLNGYVDD